MSGGNDKLALLKAKYLNEIRVREKELAALKTKLQVIEELESESDSLNGASVSAAPGKKYERMGLTEAVLDAVNTIAVASFVPSSKIKKQLLDNGFRPFGKNFSVSLYKTLKRLSESKRIHDQMTEGKRLYGASEYR